MSDAGYTLVETLGALAILGLAIGGLAAGASALGRGQGVLGSELADARALRAGQAILDQSLSGEGPFRAHEPAAFTGDGSGFRFACGEPQPCEVALETAASGLALHLRRASGERRLPLRIQAPGRFVYRGREGDNDAWPPSKPGRDALRAVILVTGAPPAESVAIAARVWREQPVACEFDALLQDCR